MIVVSINKQKGVNKNVVATIDYNEYNDVLSNNVSGIWWIEPEVKIIE